MKLIAHWKMWPKRWSTWLAGLNAVFVGYVFSQPILVVGLIGFVPGRWQVPLAIIAAMLAFALPVLVAHIRQPKLAEQRATDQFTKIQTDG